MLRSSPADTIQREPVVAGSNLVALQRPGVPEARGVSVDTTTTNARAYLEHVGLFQDVDDVRRAAASDRTCEDGVFALRLVSTKFYCVSSSTGGVGNKYAQLRKRSPSIAVHIPAIGSLTSISNVFCKVNEADRRLPALYKYTRPLRSSTMDVGCGLRKMDSRN